MAHPTAPPAVCTRSRRTTLIPSSFAYSFGQHDLSMDFDALFQGDGRYVRIDDCSLRLDPLFPADHWRLDLRQCFGRLLASLKISLQMRFSKVK